MNSNKKKTAIIVGSVATALLASAAIATALYLKGKNKLDKPKDKTTFIDFGISKEDQKEFGAHDAKVEEEFKKIRKYIEKIIENLNKGINEAGKDLSIQDYNVLINYLKDGIKIGEDAFPILDKSIKALAEYLEKQKLLQDDRKRLAETIEKAKEAIASAQSKLDGLLKDKSKVEKRAETIIRQIKEAIERAEKGVIIPEFKASIKELEELSAAAEEIKTKAKIFDLNDIINKLDSAINDAKAEIQILKDKISKQDEVAQKEAIKKFADELKDKVDKAIKKGEDAQTVEELEEAKKQIDTLKDVASEAAKEANKLNEPEAKAKIESQIQRLEEESKKLNKRIEEKKAKDSELKNELKELLEELKKAGEDAQNAQSLNDLNKAIAELEAKISKGQDLQPKLNQAKLTDEADTLKKALEKAAEILTDAKNRKDAENTRINEIKTKLNSQKQDLESKTNNIKTKESITDLENALSELTKAINDGESLNNEVKDDKSKDSFKDEYNAFAKALEDAKNQAQSSQQKLDALKQAKNELDKKVADAISNANEAIKEANQNKNSEDKDELSSVLEQISKAKSDLEKAKQDSEAANDSENKKKCEDKLLELINSENEIKDQKAKVENKEKEIAKSKEAVKEQIEALDKEIANVDKAISDKNKANIDLAKTELDKEITKAEELLEKIKNEPKLNQEHIDLNSKITDAKNKSKAAEEALKNINKAEDDAKKATQEAKQELDKAINDAKTANPNKLDDLKEKQKQLDEAIEKGNKANKQADEAGVSDQDLKDKLKEAEKEKKTLEEKIKKAEQDNINQIKQKINDAISALDGAISKVNDATQTANKHDLVKTEEAIAEIANALKTANDAKSETEANQIKYQNEFNSLVSKITDAKQKQTEILKQKQDIENERKVADKEYETLKQNVDANILLFENNSDKLDKVTEAISKLEKNLENAKKLLNESKKIKYSDLENKTSALITQIETKLIEARAKEQTLKNAQEAEKQRIEKLKDDLNAASQELENKSNILNNAQGLDNKQKALNELSEAITKANEIAKKVTDVDKTTNAKTEWENFNSKLTEATKLATDKQKEIADKKLDLDNKIKTIEKKVTDAIQNAAQAIAEKDKSKLQASKTELENLVKDLEKLKKETEQEKYAEGTKKVNDELTKVNEQLKKVSDELNSETNRISQVKEALEKATRDLKAAKTEAENNKDKVDELDKALRELETQYNLADAEYKKYNKPENTKVQELQKALQDLKNELDSYETFKNNLSKKNENTKKELDKKLENAKKEADKAIQDYDNAGEDKKKIEDAKKKLDDAKQKLDQITQDAENNGYDKAKKEAEEKSKEIDKKLKEAESKLNSKIAKELEDLINALNNQEESIKNLNKIDDLTQKLPPFLTLINNTQTSYNNLNTADNRKINEINSKLDRLSELLTTAIGTYNNRNAYLSSKKTEIENAYKDAENKANPLLEQTKNLTGKLVADLIELITNLQTAKTDATSAKNLASANGYSQYETKANELIKKIEDAIQIVTQAKTKLEGEDKLAKDLIKEIQEKIDAIDLETGKITEEIQEKIDDLKSLIDSLSSAVTEGIKFHNERNVDSNPITKRPDVIAAFGKLKDKTNISPKINDLTAKLNYNKQQIEDALSSANSYETNRRAFINKAKTDKSIPELEQALSDLKEILKRANKAKELESQKGYAAKRNEIDLLFNRINEEISEVEELLKQAKQTEAQRIQELSKKIQDQITELNNVENVTKGKFSTSIELKKQIEKLEKELKKANKLKDELVAETSSELVTPKNNLNAAINTAETTLKLAKAKANAIEQIEGFNELTPEQKQDFINRINNATDESKINQIISQAQDKNNEEKAKNIAAIKEKITKLISDLNSKSTELENGIDTLLTADLQKLIAETDAIIRDSEDYHLQNKNKYVELNGDFNNLQNAINDAKAKVGKAQNHISSGKQAIDEELKQMKDKLNEINNFIDSHNEPKEIDENQWETQKQAITKLSEDANKLKQEIQNKRYSEKSSEINTLISNINSASTKIDNALDKISKQKEINKAIKDAKDFINSLSWINKNEQDDFINKLNKANITISEINEIKQGAKTRDDEYRIELEKHREYLGKLNELLKNEQLAKSEYSEIRRELESIINTNKIDLDKYQSDRNTRIHKLDDIKSKNKNLVDANDPILVKIIQKKKELLIKEFEKAILDITNVLSQLEPIKINSKTLLAARELGITKLVQETKIMLEDQLNQIKNINIAILTIQKNNSDLDAWIFTFGETKKSQWFNHNLINKVKEYCDAVQQKIDEFEETKAPNLFSNDPETKEKYKEVYKKYYDEVIDPTKHTDLDNSLYHKIWFRTDPFNLQINDFNQHYLRFTNELIEEMSQINLNQLVNEFFTTLKLKNESDQNKFASELLKNKTLTEVGKLFELSFKTSKSSDYTETLDLDKLGDKNHLQSKLSKTEEGIKIYKDFSFSIETPTFDDIHGLVYIKISGKTTVNSKTLNTSKIMRCYAVFKKYFDYSTPQNYNGHSIVNDDSILTIDDLIQRMKVASKTITNNKFGDFVEFSGENINGLKATIDENSIKKHDSKKIEFEVKFVKENVAYVDSQSENKAQQYKDYEIGHKKYIIDFGELIKNNRRRYFENSTFEWIYLSDKFSKKASDAKFEEFKFINSKNYSWLSSVDIKYTNPNDLDGTVSIWYDTINFKDGIDKIELAIPKQSNRISGFKTHKNSIEEPKFVFEINKESKEYKSDWNWENTGLVRHGLVYAWFYKKDSYNWNNDYDKNTKYKLFTQLFRDMNTNTDLNFNEANISNISYNYGKGSFIIKYNIQFDVITSIDQNGQVHKAHMENNYEYEPELKKFILTLRYLRTFENTSATGLKQIVYYPYPNGAGKLTSFYELHKTTDPEKWKELKKIFEEFSNFANTEDGKNGIGFYVGSNRDINREKLLNKEFQEKVIEQYEFWISKIKAWFDSVGEKGTTTWKDLLSFYDLTNKDSDGQGMGDI
ncbi:hypothetical protein [Metamycoplasma equirhinis]|uniref:hypothetical protein n=1 Tax=Metamycoplasma equirhinis TaxID=92402 RepID=UPI003593AA6A